MTDEYPADRILEETCDDCGANLVRVSDGDPANPHDGDAVVCPGCLELVRVEPAG